MNENLNNAIAELARGLGTRTSELWSYLQGQGLQDYAAATVATYASYCAIAFVAAVVGGFLLFKGIKLAVKADEEGDEVSFVIGLVSAILGGVSVLVGLINLTTYLPELAGWMASPEGMVTRMLVEKIGS